MILTDEREARRRTPNLAVVDRPVGARPDRRDRAVGPVPGAWA